MKASQRPLDLKSVRSWLAVGQPMPGNQRKTLWVYRPIYFGQDGPPTDLRARFAEKGSIQELRVQALKAIEDLAARARKGEDRALSVLVWTVKKAIHELESAVTEQREVATAEAATSSWWPVLLSLNPNDTRHRVNI